jgi:hypothetical protein
MKQLTGVEWLETRAEEREKNNPNESAYWHLKQLQKDFDQAKEMEKEQIGDAWENGKKSTQCKTPMCERKTGIGYYNKTFKQEQ